ncbi:hypothetical protein C6501_01775 [Candidatus Poribacteria bacterium]|nr:MAG: hypothetical protein C6501_01775 [Candidatus Poribacteria bacterium]
MQEQLKLELTGNPWTDFGIVSFCAELRMIAPDFLVERPFLTENEATITIDTSDIETVKTWFNDRLKSRWNQIYWLSKDARIYNKSLMHDLSLKTDTEGFVVTDEKIPIMENQKKRIKELSPQTQVKNEIRVASHRLNFIGTLGEGKTRDVQKIKSEKENIVQDFVENWIFPEGKKICEISGRESKKLEEAHQVINPFLNKHQNVKVRGFGGTNTYSKVSPILRFVNLCSTLEPCIPFVYKHPTTLLILPEIANLSLLAKVYELLQINLKDVSDKNELSTATNLRGILRASDAFSLAITLFHNIFYKFTTEEEWDLAPWEEPDEVRHQVTRWVIIPFAREQNIRFGNFNTIEVDHRLYDFIRPIQYKENDDIRLVLDILSRISFSAGGENAVRYLSQAIATSDPRLMKTAIFRLWKHADAVTFSPQKDRPHPVKLLPHFIRYFLEVNAVLNKETREDLRALGSTIGSVFSSDVTLISKLYNVSSENAFREFLKQVSYRLYKVGRVGETLSDGKRQIEVQGEPKTVTPVSVERITRISDKLSEDSNIWKPMAETLSTFASLNAFNANFFKSTN